MCVIDTHGKLLSVSIQKSGEQYVFGTSTICDAHFECVGSLAFLRKIFSIPVFSIRMLLVQNDNTQR